MSSIVSQPKKVVVVVVIVTVDIVVSVVIVGPRNPTWKFSQNWVSMLLKPGQN